MGNKFEISTLKIKNIHDFLTIASNEGYTLFGNYLKKRLSLPGDTCAENYNEILVDLTTGNIKIKQISNKIEYDLSIEEEEYLLKDIWYLIDYKLICKIRNNYEYKL